VRRAGLTQLVRYVWLEDRTMVDQTLAAEDYGQVSTFPADVKYVERTSPCSRLIRIDGH